MSGPRSFRATYARSVFPSSRTVPLPDGREVVIQHARDEGWRCYVVGDVHEPTLAPAPLQAIALHLGIAASAAPRWAVDASDELMREIESAVRYPCECCGSLTLYGRSWFEICPVCHWEDEPRSARASDDAESAAESREPERGKSELRQVRSVDGTQSRVRQTAARG